MECLPPARATASMLRSGPFTRAGHRQASTVDDEMKAGAPGNAPKPEVEVLATTGQRRVIRRPKVESPQHEARRETARCLTAREMDEKPPRQGGLDREVRVRPLRASRARSVRCPGGEGRRGQPDGDVASTDQSAIRGGPALDVVLCLVRGMDSRLHPSSLVCPLATSLRIRAPTPLAAVEDHRCAPASPRKVSGWRIPWRTSGRHLGLLFDTWLGTTKCCNPHPAPTRAKPFRIQVFEVPVSCP